MGVYIHGAKIPRSCYECFCEMPYPEYGESVCGITARETVTFMNKRREDCPLTEIPEHGRLIDADDLRAEYKEPMDWLDPKQVVYHVTGIWASIDAADTVIPEERSN